MIFEEALYDYLSSHVGLSILIGDRVYPEPAPQLGTAPYCGYMRIDNEREYSHQGYSNMEHIDLQINCYAETKLEAIQVANQVTLALESWATVNLSVGSAFQKGLNTEYLAPVSLHCVPVDFTITHSF